MESLKKKRVLIIDDDESQALLVTAIIEKCEQFVHIDWAATSAEAFNFLKNQKSVAAVSAYDLIIADILLEGAVTGCDIWRLCRAEFPNVPVVLTSSIDTDEIHQMFWSESNKPYYLQKPLDLDRTREILTLSLQGGA
ncbi:MAG: response regulator [Pseudomonadota bacterium]|nr:response regulator [Pseudomonadota bacterium]